MLLTLKPPSQNGVKGSPHDYAVVHQSAAAAPRSSPPPAVSAPQSQRPMESSRSALPPPSALALPPPDVGFAHMNSMNQPLPPPPAPQRHSPDNNSFYSWIEAKTEEDKRKQEEEKTRQESLRLEQRRIEQSMLRDSLQAGVPPHMVPLIFAGISQGGVPQSVLELTQQYMAQPAPTPRASTTPLPSMPHSSQRRAPHVRRDSRSIPHNQYVAPPAQPQPVPGPGVLLSQPLHSSGVPPAPPSLNRSSMPNGLADSRAPVSSRVNPGEPQAHQPAINLSNVQYAPGSSIPPTQHSVARKPDTQPRHSPPALYFHHWVPPAQQSQPHMPPGKTQQESPPTSQAPRRSDYQRSPGRKRKAPGPHHPAPLPSSRPSEGLPGSSQASGPGSPVTPGRQADAWSYRSDTPAYEGDYDRKPSPGRSAPRDMHYTEDSSYEKDRNRANEVDRSGDPSRPANKVHFSHHTSHAPYASSIGTAPPYSDGYSSPGPSPTTEAPTSTRPSHPPGKP